MSNVELKPPSITSKKLVKKTKLRLEFLEKQNSKLNEELDQKNQEITILVKKIAASENVEIIAELGRKSRELFSDLEVSRTKCVDLERKCQNLEKLLEENLEKIEVITPKPSELQILSEKLSVSKQKYFDLLNENNTLKNEIKSAHKCLQQEIGENVNIPQLLAGQSNWKGRMEQISILQIKNQV